ncbi:MAG TPA: response regulator [Methylomirabilota bacterium]|nr:response regulator [Methylomirabilota bacterium]
MSDAPLVLNVDDYESGRYARGKVLRQAGFRVVDASTADEALRILANELPAVALVDVRLPDMNGSELCRRIKANPATASVLVVHTSAAFRRAEDRARGLDQGADAYLVEPVEPEVLVATVRALLRTRRAEDAVRLAEREWRLTFEAITDGACFVDRAGVISRCNARFGALAGVEGELSGQPVHGVFGGLLGDMAPDATHTSWTRELAVGARWLRVAVTPVPGEVTGSAGSVWIVSDITEHKRVEEITARLLAVEQQARAQAEAANRTKDEFLAVLSHELRTPLTSMLGWLRMLRTGRLDPAGVDRAYDVLERSTRLQAQIVEDLLDVSRIISGKMVLALSPVSLPTVIEAALESQRSAAAAKRLAITTEIDPAARLVADAGRLQQVFMNLISNAVKFTPAGGRITIRAVAVGRSVEIAVADTGRGITADILPFVFEPFRQAEDSHSRQHTGLGLGLAIVRHLIELHGGVVSVASDGPDRGSTFTVTLPADIEAAATPADRGEPHDVRGADLRGLRVLVVEDEGDTREILDMLLRESGADVEAVPDAEAAMHAMRSRPPDVLISDIGMPEMDGYDLIRQVRRLAPDAGGRVPAIALTAFAHGSDHREALRAGYDRHLAKPVDAFMLTRTVRDVLYPRTP